MNILDSRVDWKKCLVHDGNSFHKVDKIVPFGGEGDDIHLIYFGTECRNVYVDEEGIGHTDCRKGNSECGRVLFTLKDDNFSTPDDLKVEYEEKGYDVEILSVDGWAEYYKLPTAYNLSDCHMDTYGGRIYIYDTYTKDIESSAEAKYKLYEGKILTRREFNDAMALAKRAKENYNKIKEVIYG
jgi:hypothetical protein